VETPVVTVPEPVVPKTPKVVTPKTPTVKVKAPKSAAAEVKKAVETVAKNTVAAVEGTVGALTEASAGATAAVENAAKGAGKAAKVATKTAKVATGQGAKVILTYKEITDFFTAAGQQLPEEYDFIRTVDREIALTKKAKTDFFKNLTKEFEKKSTTPLGRIDRGKYKIFGDAARNAPSIKKPAYLPIVDQLLTDRLTPSVSGQKLGATQKSSLLNSRSQMLQGVADVSGVSKYDAAKAAKAARKVRDAQTLANAISGNIADSAPGIVPPPGVEEVYTTRPKAEIAAIEKSLAEAKSNLKIVEKQGTDVARQLGGTYKKQISALQEELLLAKSAIHEKLVPASKATSQLLTTESNLMREEMAIQNLTSGRTASGSGIGPDNPIRYANEFSDRVGGMDRVVSQKGSPVVLPKDIRAKILHDLEIEKLTQKILDSTDENIIRDLKSRLSETADDILDADVNLSGSDGNRKATAAELKKVKKETARRMAERKGVDLTKYLPTSDEFDPAAEAAILKNKKVVGGLTEFYKGIENGGDELVAELADMKKDVSPAKISAREKLAKAFARQREVLSPSGPGGRTVQPIRKIISGGMGDLPTGAGVGKGAAQAVKSGLVKISTLVDKSIDDLVDQLPIAKFSKVEKDIIRQVAKATVAAKPPKGTGNVLKSGFNLLNTQVDEATAKTIKAGLDRQVQDILHTIAKTPEIHSGGKSGYVAAAKAKLGMLFKGTNGSVAKILKNTTDLISSSNNILIDAVGSGTFALAGVKGQIKGEPIKSMTSLTGGGVSARIKALAEEVQQRRFNNARKAVKSSESERTGQPNTRKTARDAAATASRNQNDEILNRVLGEKPETPPSTTPAVTKNIVATEANTVAQAENTGATQAATTAEVKDKTVTTASSTATEVKTAATNASAATIVMSKRGEELMQKANALLAGAKFKNVAAIDALISSYTAEQLATKSGTSLVKARDGVRSSLNTLEKAKAELLKREAATIKNGLGAQNSALVEAKKKLEIATKNASKRLTDLAKASTVMTDSLKAASIPVTTKPAKVAPAAAAAAAPFYPTPTGAPIPKAPSASRKVNVGSLPAGMKIAPTDSGVIKKLGELAVSFDKSLANFFKGPNFFQGPNIFQGKIISADKLKINITDKARDSARLASARSGLAPYTDPLVMRASRRKTLGVVRKKILDDGGAIDDVRAAKLRRITGIDPRRTVGATSAVPMTRPVFGPALPTPPAAAIPKVTAFSGIKSKIDDVTKGVAKLGSMFSNVLPKAMHVTATAAVKSFNAVGRAVASSYAVNAVRAMTGGLKVVGSTADMLADGFRKSAGAVRVFNAINNATITTIKSMGAAGLVTKTITGDMAWAFGKLGKILGSTVNVEMKAFLISLQRSKLTKAWTFMLTAGMMTFVKSLRVGIAHLNIFANTGARLASAKAAIGGLTAGTSLLRKSLVGLNAFTGLSAGIQAAFSGILKSVLSVVAIVIKLNAALFLIAPVVLLITAIFIQLKRGTTNNSAALKLFKEGIVLVKGAILALANPILDIINAFGGFTGATNQTQKTAGALYIMARAFKSVSQAFNNFAQGAGQRFVKNTLGPVIIRLVNRFILLGRAIRGAMRQDGSAGKNMSAFFQSLLYEGLNVMAKLFDGLSKLLPHMGGIIGTVIGAVAKASIKMLNLIGKFGMEVGLFFGSIITGIGIALIPFFGMGAAIATAGAALVGLSLAGFAASKALTKSDAEIDKWASGVGKSVANGMGSAASGMAGFIRKGMDSIDKSYAKKIGQGINKALASTAGDPDGLKTAIQESLKKNADVAKSGGEALGAAAAKGMMKKMQDIKKTFTDGFFGKADAAVDKYVDSLKRGLEDQRDKALEAFDNQADAIQELADAEERLTDKIEYEEKKRLLIKTRALDQENYLRERKVAVYEGRTEDVRSLDLASQKSKSESVKEEKDLDLSRLKTLQGEQRDKALAVIAREKDLLAKEYEKMFRDFDDQIEKIKTVGFSTEDEFKTLLSRLGGASQTFSDAITSTFSTSMLALPTAIRDNTDSSIGMFTVSMDALVAEAQSKFGAANGTANSTSILGAAYMLATGLPDAFKTAFNDGIIAQFVTPWSSAVTADISGIIPANLWVEAAGLALIEMVNSLKRELVGLKGTLWNDFKKIFEATSEADFASIFGPALAGLEDVKKYMTGLFDEIKQIASDINLIEVSREQQSGGGGDEAKKPAGGALPGEASYVPSAYDRFEIRRGRGLADRNKITPPVSDSGTEKSGGGFFGGIKDAAIGLADQLGAVKTAILGAVGAIAGFFVLQAVFGFISTVMGVIAGALLTVSIGAAAIVAAVGIVIGLFIYLYIKVKGFRDFVNGAFIAAWEALGTVIGFVWDGIKTGVSNSLDAVKNFVQNALDFMKDVWGAIGGIVEDTFKKIISFFVDGFNALKDNIGGFVDSFINLFKGFWGAIGDGIKTIADPIMELLGKIGIAIGIAIGAIVAFAGGIVVVIVNIFDKIKGPLFSVTGFIIDIFSKIFDIATPIVEIGIGAIAKLIALPFEILNTVIDIAVGAIKIAIDIIVGVFNVLFDVFKAIASNPIVVFFARLAALLGLVAAIAATWTIKIVLESTWYVIKKVVGALIDLAEFIVGGLVGAFNIIKDVAVAAWDFIYDKVKGFVDWWHENIGSLWLIFTAPVVIAYEAIMWLFDTVKNNLGPILSSVWDGFKSAIDVVWEVMKKVSSWIGTAFGAAWGVLKKAASLYWDYLSFVIPLLWDTLKKVASWIGAAFSKVWDVISYVATNAFQILGDAISIFWGIITSGYDFIKPVFDWIADTVGNVIKTYVEILQIAFSLLWNGIMAGYDFIKPVFDWIMDIVGNIISTQVEGLKKIFGFLWDGIKAGWDLVGPIFGLMADIIGKVIKQAIDDVKFVWDLLWQGIQISWTFLEPIFNFIKDAITGGIGLAIDLIKAGWDLFVAALTNTKDFIMGVIGSIGGFIKEKIQVVIENLIGVWNGLKTAFSTVWGVIEPIISKIGGAIKSVIGGAIDFISSAISAIPQAFKIVVNSIGGLFNRAVDLLGNFAFPKTILGIPLPFIGGKKVSDFIPLPKIPTLYSGGKVGMYMKGGMAYGTGGMTNGPVQQGIPAILHGGEYVINHKAVQRIGTDTLERLNNYKLSKPNLPSMPSVPRINMPGAGINAPQYAQSGTASSSTQNVNIFVENFIGEPEWFNGMMKDYNTKVLPRNQKAAGVQSRVVSTYNGINKGL
jgi:phage-related protein